MQKVRPLALTIQHCLVPAPSSSSKRQANLPLHLLYVHTSNLVLACDFGLHFSHIIVCDRISTGDLTSRLTADCSEMANDLTWVFRFAIEATVRISLIIAYMFYFEPRLALVAIAIIPVVAAVNKWYGNWLNQNQNKVQAALASANSVAHEAVGSFRTVYRCVLLIHQAPACVDSHSCPVDFRSSAAHV